MVNHHSMRVDPLAWWTSEFASIAPVGHVLRRHLSERWTRFHSLPESKRYATDAAECDELLKRHLTVAGELFEEGEPIYVYRSYVEEERLKGRRKHQLAGRQLREKVIKHPSDSNADTEVDHYCVRSLVTRWVPDFFEALTRQVAAWEESGVTFVSPSTKNIYSPYDGGMDVFPASISPGMLEARFRSWMSARADKL